MRTPKQANLFMLIWLLLQLILSFLVIPLNELASSLRGYSMSNGELLLYIQLLGNLIPVLIVFLTGKKRGAVFLLSKTPGIKNIIILIALALTLQPAASVVSAVSSMFFDNSSVETLAQIGSGPLFTSLLLMAALPAVTEELVCRGVVLNGYGKAGVVKASFLNGLLFGIMHLNLRQFFYAFLLGTLIAYVVLVTKSVVSGIVMHFTINGSQTLMSNYFSNLPADSAAFEAAELPAQAALAGGAAVVIISAAISVLLFGLFKKHNKKRLADSAEAAQTAAPDELKLLNWPLFAVLTLGFLIMFYIG